MDEPGFKHQHMIHFQGITHDPYNIAQSKLRGFHDSDISGEGVISCIWTFCFSYGVRKAWHQPSSQNPPGCIFSPVTSIPVIAVG
jgi:hypothetical protein